MAYFGGSQGMRGDPGFFGTLFGGVKKAAKAFFSRTPVGAAVGAVWPTQGFRGGTAPAIMQRAFQPPPGGRIRITPTGIQQARFTSVDEFGNPVRRRRRMNPANPKALRKAIRRQNAFVNLAKGALKNSGFKVVSTSAGKVSRATMDKAVAKAHHSKR